MGLDNRSRARGAPVTNAKNLFVTAEGLDPHVQKAAEKELKAFYSTLASERRDAGFGVQVPKNLEEAVVAVLDQGQGVKGRFSDQGRHHAVRGTTIPVRSREMISIAILFHPSIFRMGPWRRRPWRRHIYAHEEGHALDYLALAETIGRARFFEGPNSARDFFWRRAYHVASEYRAERWAVESDLKLHGGREPAASTDFPSYELEVEGLVEAVKELPPWLAWIAERLHAEMIPFAKFVRSVLARLDEVLNYSAYATARADALSRNFRSLSEMQTNPSFAFFYQTFGELRPVLRSLASMWTADDDARLAAIAESLRAFYDTCGLTFDDGPNGIGMNVRVSTIGRGPPTSE